MGRCREYPELQNSSVCVSGILLILMWAKASVTREKLLEELSLLAVVGDSAFLPYSENRHFLLLGLAVPFLRFKAGKDDFLGVLGRWDGLNPETCCSKICRVLSSAVSKLNAFSGSFRRSPKSGTQRIAVAGTGCLVFNFCFLVLLR